MQIQSQSTDGYKYEAEDQANTNMKPKIRQIQIQSQSAGKYKCGVKVQMNTNMDLK